jgi:serine/threonine protein kinase
LTHQSLQALPTDNPSYAVKKLRHHNYDAFDVEVSNLKRFSAKDHLHLIKLLVTYSWREHYYLLFPWADGNLKDFWERYPKPSTPRRDYQLTLWFTKQCLGIAEGLKMIHTLDMPDTEALNSAAAHQTHGRHGDLKPENILWFKDYQDKDPQCQGVLKISDFGLTRFHGTRSKSHIDADTIAVTGTYRAPEYDVNKSVSQSYDVWTLGCVFLEFVTWYLLGWEEVDKFSRNRMDEHDSEVKEDVFFNFVNMRDDHGRTQTGARAKPSVANVCSLRIWYRARS